MEVLSYFPYINDILDVFKELEKQFSIKILNACEMSSQVYGWASETSDYDLKFVYVNSLDYYVSIDEKKSQTIEYELPQTDKRPAISFVGWELGKALKQIRASNSGFLEWLFSPTIYLNKIESIEQLRILAGQSFQFKSFVFSYISIASKHHKLYFQTREAPFKGLKKYFYVARPLLAVRLVLEQYETNKRQNKLDIYNVFPPLSLRILLKKLSHVPDIPHKVLSELLALKQSNDEKMKSTQTEKIQELEDWFTSEFKKANSFAESIPIVKESPSDPFNNIYVSLFKQSYIFEK